MMGVMLAYISYWLHISAVTPNDCLDDRKKICREKTPQKSASETHADSDGVSNRSAVLFHAST